MKHLKKISFVFVILFSASLHAFSIPFAFRAVGFVASRAFALVKNVRPAAQKAKIALQKSELVQTALRASEPHIVKAEAWALEHPEAAMGGIIGGLMGWETSDEGVLNTTFGVASGAIAGAAVGGYRSMRVAQEAIMAELNAARVATHTARTLQQAISVELQAVQRTNETLAKEVRALDGKYQEARKALAAVGNAKDRALTELKTAARPATVEPSVTQATFNSLAALWNVKKAELVAGAKSFSHSFGNASLVVVA